DAMVVWMHERPLDRAKSYLLKHTTQTVRAEIEKVAFAVDLESLAELPAPGLGLNDIGRVSIRTHRPVFIDAYRDNRVTGAFILIDSLTNDTVAAGMILEASAARAEDARGAGARDRTAKSEVSARERRERLGHGAAAVVLSGAPRDVLRAAAFEAERALFDRGCVATVVDGTDVEGSGEATVAACVAAGLIALYVAPAKEDALVDRL